MNRVCLFYVAREMPRLPYAIRRQKHDGANLIPVQPPKLREPEATAEMLATDIEDSLSDPF